MARFSRSISAESWLMILYRWLQAFGIEGMKFFHALRYLPVTISEYHTLSAQNDRGEPKYRLKFNYPCLVDRHYPSGVASGDYFHQDLLVARRIFQHKPIKHVDVGSRIDGFVAHVATFRPIEVFDIRPLKTNVQNIIFRQYNMMSDNKRLIVTDNYCDSISCLHALEHFGLGRYGDPIDIDGHLRGFNNLYRILKPNGILYLSVPIGTERIEFNAHRVFNIKTILEYAKDRFELLEFSFVDDNGELHENMTLNSHNMANNFGCHCGCGIFILRKK